MQHSLQPSLKIIVYNPQAPKARSLSSPGRLRDSSRWSKRSADHRNRFEPEFAPRKGCKNGRRETPMGSTFFSLHYHVVFSTKERQPLILGEWRPRLHSYLGGIIRGINGVAEIIGGVK